LLRSYEGAICEEISGVRKRSTLLRHLATPLASRQNVSGFVSLALRIEGKSCN